MSNRSSTPKRKGHRGTPATTTGPKPDKSSDDEMHVDGLHVVVRLLPSNGLEGAFRVHVLPDSLEQAHLKVGDLCEFSSEDGSVGYGIAWRADDRMGNRPKNRPAKMTETIRSAFGFEEGSRVTIAKTEARILRANRIVLSDVTPAEYNKPDAVDDGCWKLRIQNLFMNCEALAMGIAFDVTDRKKYRKRFYIESIESSAASSPDTPALYSFDDRTDLVFPGTGFTSNDAAAGPSRSATPFSFANGVGGTPNRISLDTNGSISHGNAQQYRMNTDRIGGLIEQCRKLNRQLQRLLDDTVNLNKAHELCPNPALLLHGYEGTGKTLLLDTLGESGFRSVHRLERESLNGGSVSKNLDIIQRVFTDAAGLQPSIVLLDDLDTLAPTDDIAYGKTLAREIKKLQGSRVMIVGATRNPANVKSTLLEPDCFSRLIELPIPDLAAREQILNVLRRKPVFARDSLSSVIATRTHGFTARDVATLHKRAAIYGYDRYEDELEQLAMGRSPTPPAYAEVVIQVDGRISPVPQLQQELGVTAGVTIQDFELALKEVRPTALREIFTEKPNIRWSDIGGSGHVKKSFDQIIGWPLKHKDILAKFRYQPPKGVLLYGPPGCSKTLTAQAVANTYNFNFIAIKGAELISMYVGESERAIREVFRKAKAAAPCVIFFDEIDSIGSERDSTGSKGLNVLTTLLNEMDGFESLKDVFILAATNKPESLDTALMRPGRFDSHVYLGPPNTAARKEILSIATRGVALCSDVNFENLVQDLEGYSGAEIVRICHSAKEPAIRRHIASGDDVRVSAEDFDFARKAVKKGISREMLEAYEAFGGIGGVAE